MSGRLLELLSVKVISRESINTESPEVEKLLETTMTYQA